MESLGDADLAVRRALPRAAGRARQRRAQERDPQRRVRLHRDDGPRRPRARGQPRRPSGPSATARREMVGRDLADLIIPPHLRDAHRRGLARYLRTGMQHGRRAPARAARGCARTAASSRSRSSSPAPSSPGRRCSPATCATSPRRVSARRTCAGWCGMSRPRCGAWRPRWPRRRTRNSRSPSSRRKVASLLGAQSANMVRFDADGVGGTSSSAAGARAAGEPCRSAATCGIDGDTVSGRVHRTRRARPDRLLPPLVGERCRRICKGSASSARSPRPIFLDGRLWGDVIVSSREPDAFPAGAEQRIADFAELAAQALANAQARAQLAASRSRIVAAGDDARRRLERNLHDGAQQRLVSLALTLRMAARRPRRRSRTSTRAGRGADAGARGAARARPRHPSRGPDRARARAGRRVARRAARRCPSRSTSASPSGCPAPVEAAAYYVVAEALTNVAKYARASEVTVGVGRSNSHALHRGARRRRRRRRGRPRAPACAASRIAWRRSAGGSCSTRPRARARRCAPRSPSAGSVLAR